MDKLKSTFDRVIADKVRAFPEKARVIEKAKKDGRLLAIRGSMDYVEKVLPFCYAAEKVVLNPSDSPPDLNGFDAIFVGCPGRLQLKHWEAPLQMFVDRGGVLLTTDWSVKHVIEKIFPGTIRKRGTAAGTFPLRVRNPKHPLLEGINCENTPWVVEPASHRIGIVGSGKVDVILDAPAMGEPANVLVSFPFGKGLVVHAISHFHLQGSDKTGYVSAYLLTNVIDEAVQRNHVGLSASRIRIVEPAKSPVPKRIRILT